MKFTFKQTPNPSSIKVGKRFGAFISDLVIFIILTGVFYVFVPGYFVAHSKTFQEHSENREANYEICESMLEESGLLSFDDDGGEINPEILIKDEIDMFSNGSIKTGEKYNEIFYSFYLEYANEKLEGNYDVSYVNTNCFQVGNENSVFILGTDGLVTLTETAKTNLPKYIEGEINAETDRDYQKYMNVMSKAWNDASDVLGDSETFKTAAKIYQDSQYSMLFMHSMAALVTFTVFYFVYYLMVPALFGKGQTFAKKVLQIGVFYQNSKPISFKRLLSKVIFSYLFFLWVYPTITLFALNSSLFFMPIIYTGGFMMSAAIPCFLSLLFAGLSFVSTITSVNHCSLADNVCRVVVLKENPDYVEEDINLPKEEEVVSEVNPEDGSEL